MIKYYVWHSQTDKSWVLDSSGNDQPKMILIKSFRAKTWPNAQKRFQKIRKENKL